MLTKSNSFPSTKTPQIHIPLMPKLQTVPFMASNNANLNHRKQSGNKEIVKFFVYLLENFTFADFAICSVYSSVFKS